MHRGLLQNRIIQGVIASLFSVGLLYILFKDLNLQTTVESFGKFNLGWVVFAGFAYIFLMIARAMRLKSIIRRKISLLSGFRFSVYHSLLLNTLPLRLGDVGFPFLLNKMSSTPLSQGVSAIIIFRLLDVIVVGTVYFFAILFAGSIPMQFSEFLPLILLITGLSVIIIGVLLVNPGFILNIFRKIWAFFPILVKNSLGVKYLTKLTLELNKVRKQGNMFGIIYYSYIVWLFQFTLLLSLIRGAGIELDIASALVGTLFLLIVNSLPIQGLLGFGTFEGGLSAGLILLGVSAESAIIASLLSHVAILLFAVLTALSTKLFMEDFT